MSDSATSPSAGDRLAKVIARSGLCSRRDAEMWITAGRVTVNGKKVLTPAFNVTDRDQVTVDGAPLAARQGTRVWLYHKPAGLVVTEKDPEGRPTIFEALEAHGLPRVVTVGRLDINTEGLLLLTNDGGLKRVLELPSTGWLRRYRVRAHGSVTQAALDRLKDGIEVDGIRYGPIEAVLEREQGSNIWLVVSLREGKNREVKNVLGALGLEVNRLIRVSYGPFQLGTIPVGGIETIRAKMLRDQLGKKLADAADVDFDSDMPELNQLEGKPVNNNRVGRGSNTVEIARQRFRFTDKSEREEDEDRAARRAERTGRGQRPMRRNDDEMGPPRRIHFDEDGRAPEEFTPKRAATKRFDRDDQPARTFGQRPERETPDNRSDAPRAERGDRPAQSSQDRPARASRDRSAGGFGDRPARRDGGSGGKSFGDRSSASRSDSRPARSGDGAGKRPFGDRPSRPFGDKQRGTSRPEGEHTPRSRPEGASARPARDFGDRPQRSRPEGDSKRPGRNFSPRPQRPADGADRPQRSGGKPFGDRNAAPRGNGKPGGSGKPFGNRPERSGGRGGLPAGGGRPAGGGGRPAGGGRPNNNGGRPGGSGGRPGGNGSRPGGRPGGNSRPRS